MRGEGKRSEENRPGPHEGSLVMALISDITGPDGGNVGTLMWERGIPPFFSPYHPQDGAMEICLAGAGGPGTEGRSKGIGGWEVGRGPLNDFSVVPYCTAQHHTEDHSNNLRGWERENRTLSSNIYMQYITVCGSCLLVYSDIAGHL